MGRKAVWWVTEIILVWVSVLFALAALGTLIAPQVDPTHWELGYLLSLMAVPILCVNVFFFVWWLVNRYWWVALVPLVGIGLQYETINGYVNLFGKAKEPIADLGTFVVASYNIHEFRGKANIPGSVMFELSELIAKEKIDVVCFQEFKQARELTADTIAKILNMPYFALAGNGNKDFFYDVAIFSKYPIVDQGVIEIKSPTRVAQWAHVKFPDGVVSVVNCHLQSTEFYSTAKVLNKAVNSYDLSTIDGVVQHQVNGLIQTSKVRANQAQSVVNFCNGVGIPLLLCGDFNSPPNSYAYNLVAQNLSDSFVYSESLTEPTYSVLKQSLRIDYVFFNTHILPLSHRTVCTDISDHSPVLFRFQIADE